MSTCQVASSSLRIGFGRKGGVSDSLMNKEVELEDRDDFLRKV